MSSTYQINTMQFNPKPTKSNFNLPYLNDLQTCGDNYQSKLNNDNKLKNNLFLKLKSYINLELFNFKLIFLCLIWYFTSVISSSTTKQILKDFKYPVTLTEIQFIITALLCLLLLNFVKLFNNKLNSNLINKFPNGTFPPNLVNDNYSILNNFLKPSLLILKTTIPMGMFQFLGQIASHNATSIIPVSLVHTIKALSPLSTVLIYRFLFNKNFPIKTYLTLIPLITGVMLSCTRNDNLNLSNYLFYKGSLFAFISMLIFVSQNIFAKKILTWDDDSNNSSNTNNEIIFNDEQNDDDDDYRAKAFLNRLNWKITRPESAISTPILPMSITPPKSSSLSSSSSSNNKTYFNLFENNNSSSTSISDLNDKDKQKFILSNSNKKLDKLSVLFYCSIIGFFLTLPFYLISEFNNDYYSINFLNNEITNLILIYGLSHFIQSLMAFQILGMISPVNYSIANILKRIIIISCSIIIEDISLNFQQWFGLSLTFIGLYCYDRWGSQRK